MNIVIYAFSNSGALLSDKIIESFCNENIEAFVPEKYVQSAKYVKLRKDNLYKSVAKSFTEKDCIIFIGAAGIAVRAIAQNVRSKKTDPAVICVDERGINVISLLSGHIGRANELTVKLASAIGGNPIITTATDVNNKFAVDQWASSHNLHITSLKKARDVAADILENKPIGFTSDFNVEGCIPKELIFSGEKTGICVSLNENKKPFESTLTLIPKIISIGVGCKNGADFNDIYDAIREVLRQNNISIFAVKSLNSIELKKDEKGIIKAAKIFKVPFHTYAKEQLNKIKGDFTASDFVREVTGVDSVCERAALMDSNSSKLIIKKTIINSVTVAASQDDYTVEFKEFKSYNRQEIMKNIKITEPHNIEKRSFEIIQGELGNIKLDPELAPIIKRVIHTTADFDYLHNLCFSDNAVKNAKKALKKGATIVTDTNMAAAGINKKAAAKYGINVICFMADEDISKEAHKRGETRAVVSMEKASKIDGPVIFAIGNAPTALIKLCEMAEEKQISPELIIGVPVGFVNVVEAKELLMNLHNTEYIAAKGRKGGSNVAAAICNAILYSMEND